MRDKALKKKLQQLHIPQYDEYKLEKVIVEVQIASEGIVKLSSKGKYISTVASVEAEKGSVRRNIVGMVPTEHGEEEPCSQT